MDKLNPAFQATPVTTQAAPLPALWYGSEVTGGEFTAAELGWLHAQGWRVYAIVTVGATTTYSLTRRIIRPENVLNDLVSSYTDAYNEGRQLNDQRYDDLLALYTAILDKTEDELNELVSNDLAGLAVIETILTSVASDFTSYESDVDDDLDQWGTDLLAEINARFDAELAKAESALVDRGLYSSVMWTTISAGVERERTRALNQANDQIEQRQLELKHKVYGEQQQMRDRLMAARERVFVNNWGAARERQLSMRNAAAEALARLVERREDSYPDLSEIGRLAAGLGGGSPEAFSP